MATPVTIVTEAGAAVNPAAPVIAAGSAIIGKVGIDQTTPGTTDSVTVKSAGHVATFTFTAAAAAYSANDVVDTAKQASVALGPSGGGEVIITSIQFEIDETALQASETSYNLQLYNVTPPSAHADNAAWDLPSGDRAAHMCTISLGTPVDLGSTLKIETDILNKQVTMPSGSRPFAELVTVGGATLTATVRKVTMHTTEI